MALKIYFWMCIFLYAYIQILIGSIALVIPKGEFHYAIEHIYSWYTSDILSGLVFLLRVEVCAQQGTGAVLLRQTSAVLQSTTSLKNSCGRKVNGLFMPAHVYGSRLQSIPHVNSHVTLHNMLAQSLLVFLVKTF